MSDTKTSTFIIHHDRCKPQEWTPDNVLALARFIGSGDVRDAAVLARMGLELVASEHHVPKGGTLQEVGFATPECDDLIHDDISELIDYRDMMPVVRVYRGPVEYAIAIPFGDGEGNFEGYEYEFKKTEAEALAYVQSLREEMDEQSLQQSKADQP